MSLGPMFNYDDPEGATGYAGGISSAGMDTSGTGMGAAPAMLSGGAHVGVNYGANVNLGGTIAVWAFIILGTMWLVHHDRSSGI